MKDRNQIAVSSQKNLCCLMVWTCKAGFLTLLAMGLFGQAVAETFVGPITHKEVYYRIILPANYDNSQVRRYPVIYHLHGLGRDADTEYDRMKPHLDSAMSRGIIRPVIMVFAEGYRNTMWSDSYDGKKPAETNVIKELIPYIDAHYRTKTSREFRVIEGWSMGGYGAMEYLAKFSKLFSIGVAYDGAFWDWSDLMSGQPNICKEVFNNDSTNFTPYNVWHNLDKHGSQMKKSGVKLVVVQAALTGPNQAMKAYLARHSFNFQFKKADCTHQATCVYDQMAAENFTFIEKHLGKSPSAK